MMDLERWVWEGGVIYWISLALNRDKWRASVTCVNKPLGSIKCWKVLEWQHKQWPFE
jgi:hypothetical protein